MTFHLGRRSRKNLIGVEPTLVAVVERAIQITRRDFGVTEGLRLRSRQRWLYDSGKATTMVSLHLKQADGYSHAVDIYTRDDEGRVTWDHKYFRWVIQAFFTAAIELGVQIEAGGLWRDFVDSPHFQLHQAYIRG